MKAFFVALAAIKGQPEETENDIVKQLLEKNDTGSVVATCRNPSEASGLAELKKRFGQRLDVQKLDVTIESSIENVANTVGDKFGCLNHLINASRILSIPKCSPSSTETTLSKVQKSSLLLAYEANAVGPTLVTKVLSVKGGEEAS